MHQVPRPTLGRRRRLEKPGHPVIESQTASDPPGVLKERSHLRRPKLHDRQAGQHAVCGVSKQEIGEGVAGRRDGRELPLGVGGQLRREHRLEGQASQRNRVSVQMPPAPVAQPGAERQAVSSPVVRELLVQLPGVVPVSYFAVGSSKGRVPLKVYRGDSVPAKRIGDADLVENRPERLALIASHGSISKKTEAEAVHHGRAERPGMLQHGEGRLVLIRETAQREQSWLHGRRALPKELTEQLGAWAQRHVHSTAALLVVERPARVCENIAWPAREARARTVVRQKVPGDRVHAARRYREVGKRLTDPGFLPVSWRDRK